MPKQFTAAAPAAQYKSTQLNPLPNIIFSNIYFNIKILLISQSDFEVCALQELLNHNSYYVQFLHAKLVIIALN